LRGKRKRKEETLALAVSGGDFQINLQDLDLKVYWMATMCALVLAEEIQTSKEHLECWQF